MICVSLCQTSQGECRAFRLDGHAGAGQEGQDIVCAAVSVLVLNTINSIERFTEDHIQYQAAEDGGHLAFSFVGEISQGAALLVRSMIAGLQDVQQQYGKRYIKIRYEEV